MCIRDSLRHDQYLLANYEIDLIISFDPMLETALPALQLLKNNTSKSIPVIKLLVQNSPDHYLLDSEIKNSNISSACIHNIDRVDNSQEYDEIKSSLLYFLHARNVQVDNCDIDYAKLVKCCLEGKDCNDFLPALDLITLDENFKDSKDSELWKPQLTKLQYSSTIIPLWDSPLDIKSYQTELMHRAVIRLRDIQGEYTKGTAPLNEKRLKENQRQNKLDDIKNSVGLTFKKKQELEKSINDSEKRYRPVSYTHLDVYKRQLFKNYAFFPCDIPYTLDEFVFQPQNIEHFELPALVFVTHSPRIFPVNGRFLGVYCLVSGLCRTLKHLQQRLS